MVEGVMVEETVEEVTAVEQVEVGDLVEEEMVWATQVVPREAGPRTHRCATLRPGARRSATSVRPGLLHTSAAAQQTKKKRFLGLTHSHTAHTFSQQLLATNTLFRFNVECHNNYIYER
jgi:hypothetical protein